MLQEYDLSIAVATSSTSMLDAEECQNISILSYDIVGLEWVVVLLAELFWCELGVVRDGGEPHIEDDLVGLGVGESEETSEM